MNKRVGPIGPRRGDRKRFPYEARIVSGRLVTPAELQTIHRFVLDTAVIEAVSDEVRDSSCSRDPMRSHDERIVDG
jgi:hypothetical protein